MPLPMQMVLVTEHATFGKAAVRLKLSTKMLFFEELFTYKLVGCSDLECIIGAACENIVGTQCTLIVYRYVLRTSIFSKCFSLDKYRTSSHLSFKMYDPQECERWATCINNLCGAPYFGGNFDIESLSFPRKRKFLIVINPVAGRGKSVQMWEKSIRPLLQQGDVECTVKITTGPNHAKMYVQAFDWSVYDAVVTVGGDGTLAEVINGLCVRDDGQQALSRLVLVPVGGGSGNGLIRSILFSSETEYSLTNAIFCALKGSPQPLDLAYVQTMRSKYHSFLLLGWGLTADIDILSEPMRWMGEMRLYVAAVYFILQRRVYEGKLSLLKADSVREAPSSIPPLGSPLTAEWEVIQGEFTSIMILQTSHCSTSMHSGPGVRLDDGVFTIQVVRDVTRFQLLQLLLSFDSGDHVNNAMVTVYKAYAYRLEPLTAEGRFTLDGENIEYGPIQGLIMNHKATTFKLHQERGI